MLRNILRSDIKNIQGNVNVLLQSYINTKYGTDNKIPSQVKYEDISPKKISDQVSSIKFEKTSMLETCKEDISYVAPYLKPTYNFASYVNKSATLQQMLKMGVNLHKIEKIQNATQYILGLDFENDMKPYIIFLHDLGLSVENIANLIAKNPFIFKETIENLEVRINYLQSKKFDNNMIIRILEKNPHLLSYETQELDMKLGFLMKSFHLTASELRQLVTNKPQLITYNEMHITKNIFIVKEEMGFTHEELKKISLNCPVIFMKNRHFIRKTFEFLHKDMGVALDVIAEFPEALTCREHRLKQRHTFLQKLHKAQYDPKKPNYVSIAKLVSGDDTFFCSEVAKSSVQTYNMFLKSL